MSDGHPVTAYMFGYFAMKGGCPNLSRYKQVKLLMQKENIKELALRIYPSFS